MTALKNKWVEHCKIKTQSQNIHRKKATTGIITHNVKDLLSLESVYHCKVEAFLSVF